MDEQFYKNLEQEYRDFYYHKIKPELPEFERIRKLSEPRNFNNRIVLGAFLLSLVFSGFFAPFGLLFFVIFVAAFIRSFFLPRGKPNFNIDNALKKRFMYDFLKIFSKASDWFVGSKAIFYVKSFEYHKLNIFNNFIIMSFDDIITMSYNDVEISVFEGSTSLFDMRHISHGIIAIVLGSFVSSLLVFPIVIFSMLIASLNLKSSLELICFILLFILVLLSLFIKYYWPIIKYSAFKGAIVEIKFNKKFKGHTFFLNNSIASKKISIDKARFEKVQLESVDFSNKYEVYSTDQVESRYLLTTAMMERLNNLNFSFKANFVRGAFKDDKLILAIDTGRDMFAMGSDFKASDIRTFRLLFDEIVSIMKIVDQLKLDSKLGL